MRWQVSLMPIRCNPGTLLTGQPHAPPALSLVPIWQQTPQPVRTQLRILHWPAVSPAAESLYWLIYAGFQRSGRGWVQFFFYFHSNVSNGNISHTFNCPLGRTTVCLPLADRISTPDTLAPRTAIFSLTFLRQKDIPYSSDCQMSRTCNRCTDNFFPTPNLYLLFFQPPCNSHSTSPLTLTNSILQRVSTHEVSSSGTPPYYSWIFRHAICI